MVKEQHQNHFSSSSLLLQNSSLSLEKLHISHLIQYSFHTLLPISFHAIPADFVNTTDAGQPKPYIKNSVHIYLLRVLAVVGVPSALFREFIRQPDSDTGSLRRPSHEFFVRLEPEGNGHLANFWHDPWLQNSHLAERFPRLYAIALDHTATVAQKFLNGAWCWSWRRPIRGGSEECQLVDLLNALGDVSLSDSGDSWNWVNSSSNSYSVSQARILIASSNYVPYSVGSRWCSNIPIKVNIFIWRLNLNRLPTLSNLESRNILVDRDCCALCDVSEEDRDHLFIRCDTSYQIWCRIGVWLGISFPILDSVEDLWNWIDSYPANDTKKLILQSIASSTLWNIWRLRNGIIFKDHNTRKSYVFDYIVLSSFNWIFSRYRKSSLNWTSWLLSPLNSL
ncbi:uncharacterized protein [Rutidosis leptorrhynchoides]|uniref:uncharacterized protein n=1 Tax=Rutidosis leptorrhynchoides TaxID=125765 RepID=UPI003A99EFBC